MAKKKSTLGKLLAFTTAVAAVGGACYIFRDQIKESEVYKKASDKFSSLRNKVSDKFASEEDDFFFDDEFEDDFDDDIFDDDTKGNREYTSITINAKTEPEEVVEETADEAVDTIADANEKATDTTDEMTQSTTDVAENIADTTTESVEEISDLARDVANDVANAVREKTEVAKDEVKEIFADDSIPTISFGTKQTESKDETAATEEVLGYENEGLSDVYEDPDILGDQDKLDF